MLYDIRKTLYYPVFALPIACAQMNQNVVQSNSMSSETKGDKTNIVQNKIPSISSDIGETNISDEELFLDLRENHWIKIFPNGGRNAGGPQFFKYIYENLATSHDLFQRYNKFYCGVSGSIVYPGNEERYDIVKVKDMNGQCVVGEYRRCCWPCSCDVMKHARAESVEIQLPNDPNLEVADYWVLTIGDPCHKCDDMPCEDLPEEVTGYQCKDGHTQNGLRVFQGKLTTEREGRLVFAMLHNVDTQNLTSSSVPSELLNACQPRINANPIELQNMSGMGNIFVDLSLINSSEHYSNNNDDLCQ